MKTDVKATLISAVALGTCLFTLTGCSPARQATRAYRELPKVCLPCGGESYVAIASDAQLKRVQADLLARCAESRSPTEWRDAVERTGIDFSKEALVIMHEVIGTGGKATLNIEGPTKEGVLDAAITWETPDGPALPIATQACFSFAVDKSIVKRVDIPKGGVLSRNSPDKVLSLDIPSAPQ